LGRSAHSWGINETEYFNLASNSREVHATAPEAAVAELANISAEPHAELGLTDFFVVPTITFRLLFVFVILSHDRRRPVHFAVTANPTAEWTARQLLEAFPWDTAPSYLLRDRDGIYGQKFREAATWLGIREVLTAPQSPWQNPYVERFIGSIRRECLDHVIALNETGLHRVLKSYFKY
jgi:putative transposase